MSNAANTMLDEAWAAIDAGNTMRARSLARRVLKLGHYRDEATHVLGVAALVNGDVARALVLFDRAISLGGNTGTLYYDKALAHEQAGDHRRMVAAFLKTRELDEAEGVEHCPGLTEDILVETAEELLGRLPPEMTSRLGNVPILVEERPAVYLVEEGFDPRALGLFDGPSYAEQGMTGPALNQIVLYRANIAAAARGQRDALEQVRITLLHETAHFFGLDEDGVAALGLA